jgi:hypothetical protein
METSPDSVTTLTTNINSSPPWETKISQTQSVFFSWCVRPSITHNETVSYFSCGNYAYYLKELHFFNRYYDNCVQLLSTSPMQCTQLAFYIISILSIEAARVQCVTQGFSASIYIITKSSTESHWFLRGGYRAWHINSYKLPYISNENSYKYLIF